MEQFPGTGEGLGAMPVGVHILSSFPELQDPRERGNTLYLSSLAFCLVSAPLKFLVFNNLNVTAELLCPLILPQCIRTSTSVSKICL